jgi:hypothetical protein
MLKILSNQTVKQSNHLNFNQSNNVVFENFLHQSTQNLF